MVLMQLSFHHYQFSTNLKSSIFLEALLLMLELELFVVSLFMMICYFFDPL